MFALIASVQKFAFIADTIFGITVAIARMSWLARTWHGSAEVRQDSATYLSSQNVTPELENLRVAFLIIHNKCLRSLIVTFHIGSPIADHEVDRNAALGRWD